MTVNSALRERLSGPGQAQAVRCRFNLDTRLCVTRLMLCLGLAACSVIAGGFAGLPVPVTLLILLLLPLTGLVAWFSYRQLRWRNPVIVMGRRGIWDRRLDIGIIPWEDVSRIRTDSGGNVILDPSAKFSRVNPRAGSRLEKFLRGFDRSMKPGSVKIRLNDVDAEIWDVLAGIEASLPHQFDSLWHAATKPDRVARPNRTIVAGFGAAAAAVLLIVLTDGSKRDAPVVLHNLGPATDVGAAPDKIESPALTAYRRAAERGDTDARMRLGLMFHEGEGVARDQEQAAYWFRLAAADDLPAAQAALGYLHELGLGVAQNFGAAQAWYKKAVKEKHPWALYRLGLMYRDGRGVPKNLSEALALLTAAAEEGDVAGRFHLGEMYENGWGIPQDAIKASTLYRKAAEQNHEQAEYNLAALYRDGRGVPKDDVRAALWFERAASKGFAPAQYALGLAHEGGRGVANDLIRAALWYHLARLHGHKEAANRRKQILAVMTVRQRKEAEMFRRQWLQENLLKDEAAEKFAEYRSKNGPKAFAIAMNGAWAQTEVAKHVRDAVDHAMRRCRQYAQTCLLFAVGDSTVAGMRHAEIDAVIAKQIRRTAAR